MKTLKLLFVALALCILQTSASYAGSNSEMLAAKKDLRASLSEVFKNMPFADIYDENCSPEVHLYFKINENRELQFARAVGQNKDLVRYVEVVLSNKKFEAPEVLGEGPIRIDLKLQNIYF